MTILLRGQETLPAYVCVGKLWAGLGQMVVFEAGVWFNPPQLGLVGGHDHPSRTFEGWYRHQANFWARRTPLPGGMWLIRIGATT